MSRYEELRNTLIAVQAEFVCFSGQSRLYHDLIWSPDREGWTDEEFTAFVQANGGQGEVEWERWSIWPNRIACGRYWGGANFAGLLIPTVFNATFVQEFVRLARRGYGLLHEIWKLEMEARPADCKVGLAFWAERHQREGCGGEYGWLELIHEWGWRFPTTGLQTRLGRWGYDGPPPKGDDFETLDQRTTTSAVSGIPYHVHPSHSTLQLNVFQSSAEFIRLCLSPEEVVDVGFWDRGREIDLPEEPAIPYWDAGAGELWYIGHLIKKFSKPAVNQRKVLDSFQGQKWRTEVSNPFRDNSKSFNVAALDTLGRTVEALNDDHVTPGLIHFGTRANKDFVTWKAKG